MAQQVEDSGDDNVSKSLESALEWAENHWGDSSAISHLSDSTAYAALVADRLLYHTILYPQQRTSLASTEGLSQISCLLTQSIRQTLPTSLFPLTWDADEIFDIREYDQARDGGHFPTDETGLYAVSTMRAGTTILVERPVLLLPAYMSFSGLAVPKAEVYAALVRRLPVKVAEEIFSMKIAPDLQETCGMVEGIIRTNGLAVTFPAQKESTLYSGLFLNAGRCNHSCTPNAVQYWDPKTLSLALYAAKDIEKDSPITIAYMDVVSPTAQRQMRTKSAFNFRCVCNTCSQKKKDRADSDKRRSRMQEILALLEPFHVWFTCEDDDAMGSETYFTHLDEYIGNLEAEGLQGLRKEYMWGVDLAARVAGVDGNVDRFRTAVKKARQVWLMDETRFEHVHKRICTYDRWLEDPTTYVHWDAGEEAEAQGDSDGDGDSDAEQ